MRQHQHRDLWVVLVPALLALFGGAVFAVPIATIHGKWSYLMIATGLLALVVAAYITIALIWGLPLPGGFVGHRIEANESDESLGRECLTLSQSMWDLLAEAKRNEPEWSTTTVPAGADSDEVHRHWQESTRKRQEHENKMIGQFIERFAVRLAGVLQALRSRDLLTEDELRHIWWELSTPTLHGMDEVPRLLGEKARELGIRP